MNTSEIKGFSRNVLKRLKKTARKMKYQISVCAVMINARKREINHVREVCKTLKKNANILIAPSYTINMKKAKLIQLEALQKAQKIQVREFQRVLQNLLFYIRQVDKYWKP
jgi:hypothetical protein